MKIFKSIKLAMFTAIMMGGLLGGPLLGGSMQAHAQGVDGSVRFISDSINIAPSYGDADQEDELVNEGGDSEEEAQASGDSDYKYIPIRRTVEIKK